MSSSSKQQKRFELTSSEEEAFFSSEQQRVLRDEYKVSYKFEVSELRKHVTQYRLFALDSRNTPEEPRPVPTAEFYQLLGSANLNITTTTKSSATTSDLLLVAFVEALRSSPYNAYFWETPPITPLSWDQPFEFVLVDSPELARVSADPSDFEYQLAKAEQNGGSVVFPNLGGDALLVSPSRLEGTIASPANTYAHLANFNRLGSDSQVFSFWRTVGHAVCHRRHQQQQQQTEGQKFWVSTSGLGVYWLHMRLDRRPKYYQYKPYATM